MFGLTDAQMNGVKAQSKKLGAAYEKLSKKERLDNKLVCATIDQAHSPVATIISRDKFLWLHGYMNGRAGHDENGNSLYE